MISETQIRYGFLFFRHGRSRLFLRNQEMRRDWNFFKSNERIIYGALVNINYSANFPPKDGSASGGDPDPFDYAQGHGEQSRTMSEPEGRVEGSHMRLLRFTRNDILNR